MSADNYTIFVNNKPLNSYTLTQNEYGPSHIGLRFSRILQRPLDFGGMSAGMDITLSHDVKVISQSSVSGNWMFMQVNGTPYQLILVHVDHHLDNNTIAKKGTTLCRIAPTATNGGYAIHLHAADQKDYKEHYIRENIFSQTVDPLYSVLKVQRPDVLKHFGKNVHQWWTLHGCNELNAALLRIGRHDVLSTFGSDCELKKRWYIKNGSKEYGTPPYIWGAGNPQKEPTATPCEQRMEQQKQSFEKTIASLKAIIAKHRNAPARYHLHSAVNKILKPKSEKIPA